MRFFRWLLATQSNEEDAFVCILVDTGKTSETYYAIIWLNETNEEPGAQETNDSSETSAAPIIVASSSSVLVISDGCWEPEPASKSCFGIVVCEKYLEEGEFELNSTDERVEEAGEAIGLLNFGEEENQNEAGEDAEASEDEDYSQIEDLQDFVDLEDFIPLELLNYSV